MRTLLKAALLVVFCLAICISGFAQDRGPSTQEERDMAVKAARLLETDPLHKDGKQIRSWFTFWLIQIPDITIELCSDYLGPLGGSKKNYSSEIFVQVMYSSAAFIIENPDQAKDRVAVNLAGVEGALKAYESILKAKPKARWAFLDGLIAKRQNGELRAYVEEIANTKCKGRQ